MLYDEINTKNIFDWNIELSYSSVYNSVGFMFIDPNNRAIKTFLSTEPSLKFKPFYYIATDNCVPIQYYN